MGISYRLQELIRKQLSGSITPDELSALQTWYKSSKENQALYEKECALLWQERLAANQKKFEPHVEEAYRRVARKAYTRKQVTPLWKAGLRHAAILALVFCLGAASLYLMEDRAPMVQTIEIPYGSKSKVTLPDGTSVWLNSGSKLSYDNGFGKQHRDVTLDGEGCFDVTHNKELPFRVTSDDVHIRVLGTKFNFKSYSEDKCARVTLIEGSLRVSHEAEGNEDVLLKPNQQAVVEKGKESIEVKNVDAKTYALWAMPAPNIARPAVIPQKLITASMTSLNATIRNTLLFDEEPLYQIVRDLQRMFNVEIVFEDKELGNERFYGDFRNKESLTQILDIIVQDNNLSYTVKEGIIYISRK